MSAVAPQLPSIFNLARRSNEILEAFNEIDRAHLGADNQRAKKIFDSALSLCVTRRDALNDLILTMPAVSLADVAAQLEAACRVADGLDTGELPRSIGASVAQLRRALLSAIPVVARAAGVDMETVGDGSALDLHAYEFPSELEGHDPDVFGPKVGGGME
jgi:hypothetical protein